MSVIQQERTFSLHTVICVVTLSIGNHSNAGLILDLNMKNPHGFQLSLSCSAQ